MNEELAGGKKQDSVAGVTWQEWVEGLWRKEMNDLREGGDGDGTGSREGGGK